MLKPKKGNHGEGPYYRGPKDLITIRILQSGSKAQYEGEATNPGL